MNKEQMLSLAKMIKSKWNCRDCTLHQEFCEIIIPKTIETTKTFTYVHTNSLKVKTKEKPKILWAVKWVIIFDSLPFIKKREKNLAHKVQREEDE